MSGMIIPWIMNTLVELIRTDTSTASEALDFGIVDAILEKSPKSDVDRSDSP